MWEKQLDTAKHEWKLADHLLYKIYPLVSDAKILVSSLEHVQKGYESIIYSYLNFQKKNREIPVVPDDKIFAFALFFRMNSKKLNINKDIITLFEDVEELLKFSKKSEHKWQKQNKFVMITPCYQVKTIEIDIVKKYLKELKDFIVKVEDEMK